MEADFTDNIYRHPVEVAKLARKGSNDFALHPDADACARIVAALGLSALRKVSLKGTLEPVGKRDWQLRARLGATIVQPCVVSLTLVTTRVDEDVTRIWRADMDEVSQTGGEEEMPEETADEQLTPVLDLGLVLVEALTLALPQYPRAKDASLPETVFTAPGTAPMRDEDMRPFAGLADLRSQLAGDDTTDDEE